MARQATSSENVISLTSLAQFTHTVPLPRDSPTIILSPSLLALSCLIPVNLSHLTSNFPVTAAVLTTFVLGR